MTKDDAPLRYTVIVGVNEGPGDRPVLSYADDDAARLFLLLSQESEKAWLLSTFDPPSARTYPDLSSIARAPTTSELARVLGEAYWLIR